MADEIDEGAKLPEDARIESLDERLRRAQEREAARVGTPGQPDQDEKAGSRVLSLLLGGVFGGTLLGWLAGRLFGAETTGLIAGLVIGVVAAFYSILKMAAPRQ